MSQPMLGDPRVQRAIELIWLEARMLDDKDYEAWLELWDEKGIYVVPIDPHTEDFGSSLNMIYDDNRMRRMRVDRMIEGYAPSAVAAARTVRTISRFTVEEVSDEQVVLRSAQILSAYKRNHFDTLGADLTHTIALNGDDAVILGKVVRLINSTEAVSASGYLL